MHEFTCDTGSSKIVQNMLNNLTENVGTKQTHLTQYGDLVVALVAHRGQLLYVLVR